jgi:hypothetical protein
MNDTRGMGGDGAGGQQRGERLHVHRLSRSTARPSVWRAAPGRMKDEGGWGGGEDENFNTP